MSNIIRLIDRSRTVTDWKCPRARYWGYEYLGRGIRPETTSLALSTGIIIHDAMAAIATYERDKPFSNIDVPIDTIANLAFQQMYEALVPEDIQTTEQVTFGKEQASLTEGMIRGFYKHVWPRLMSDYPKIVAIEQEVEYPIDPEGGFVFMAKPDLLLENSEGDMVYVEYKSTSSKQEKWINSWDTAVQLHSSIKAVEHTLGKAPDYVQIVGLYKGYESYGKQNSPFCYAYMKKGNPPFTSDIISYEYKSGLKRYPTWELPGGVKEWVEGMPEEVLVNQFPMTMPITINDDLIESFFKQRLVREKEIGTYDKSNHSSQLPSNQGVDEEHLRDTIFPQRFDQCTPSFGYGCEFKRLCHGGPNMDGINGLPNGFNFREPHHARELEEFAAQA